MAAAAAGAKIKAPGSDERGNSHKKLIERKRLCEMNSGKAKSSRPAKKRAPLRHAAIETAMQGPARKKRATNLTDDAGIESDDSASGDYMDTMEENLAEDEVGDQSLKNQARQQRRDIYTEGLSAGEPMAADLTPSEAVAAARKLYTGEVCMVKFRMYIQLLTECLP